MAEAGNIYNTPGKRVEAARLLADLISDAGLSEAEAIDALNKAFRPGHIRSWHLAKLAMINDALEAIVSR